MSFLSQKIKGGKMTPIIKKTVDIEIEDNEIIEALSICGEKRFAEIILQVLKKRNKDKK